MKFKDNIRVTDSVRLTRSDGETRQRGGGGAPPIIPLKVGTPVKVGSNVRLTLRDKPGGKIIEERNSHNIFLNYGREWVAELIGLDTGYSAFRNDRCRYMVFGIGGTSQLIASATLRSTWAGFPDAWDYSDVGDLSTGGLGGAGGGDPAQDDTDPAVTGLEYPVQITDEDYYDDILAPASFPEAGVIRLTSILGYNEVSFAGFTSVPLSEIGLITESRIQDDFPPLDSAILVSSSFGDRPPIGVRYMVAYNTFNTLSKTSAFVLQVDWELRIS